MGRFRSWWSVIALALLAACAHAPAAPRSAAIVSAKQERLPAPVVQQLLHPMDLTYRLGPGDVVSVNVYLHPDLSVPAGTAAQGAPGALVSNRGNIELPLLGVVPVQGLTAVHLRHRLMRLYRHYLKHPHVAVQIQKTRSVRYYLVGEFTHPGLRYSDRPLDVLDVLALGGSVRQKDADLRGAYVVQASQKLPLDLYGLIVHGDLNQNIPLMAGDTVVVPSVADMRAFVFGAVSKPGPVPFVGGRLTLLQALADAGMDIPSLTNARLSKVHIIRAHGASGEFLVVDARRIMRGDAPPFVLQSGDIIYVPQTAISHWNQVLGELLPSLTTVSALLNPFVDIKFLRQ